MATRKIKRNTRAARSQAGSSTDPTRAQNVLLEQLKSQMDGVLEAVTGSRAHLEAAMENLRKDLSERIRVLEEVVRQNSADIRQNSEDIRQNSADIRDLRDELARLRYDFDHRAELSRVAALESRVTALEKRVGVSS